MRTTATTLIVFSLFAATACAQSAPSDATLGRIGLERMWVSQARVNPGRDRVTHLTVDEMHVYVQSDNGSLTAFDAESGRRHWSVQLGSANRTTYAAVSNADTVLVITSSYAYGVEKSSGHVLWSVKVPASASTSAIIDDKYFYVGTGDGSMYAFSLEVVEYLNRTGRLPGSFDPSTKVITSPIGEVPATHTWLWRYRTGRSLRQRPSSAAGSILLADSNGQVYGITSGTPQDLGGKLRFQFQAGSGVAGRMLSRGNVTYIPTADHVLAAVDSTKGQLLWRYRFGRRLSDPLLIGDTLYLSAEAEGLVGLDVKKGSQKRTESGPWLVPRATKMVGATKSLVFASDQQRNLIAVDRETAELRGQISLYAFDVRYQNDLNDRLYMATSGGLVMALREPGAEDATFYRNQDRTPIDPILAEDGEEAAGNEGNRESGESEDGSDPDDGNQ